MVGWRQEQALDILEITRGFEKQLGVLGTHLKKASHRCGSATFNTVEPIETNEWFDDFKGGKRLGVNNGLIEVEPKSIETMESIWLKVNAS